MGEISGTFSKDVHIDILFDLLGGFLSALGATAGIISKIQNYYQSKGAKFAKFRFVDSVREYADVAFLNGRLKYHPIKELNLMYKKGRRYYLVTGVIRSPSISITAEDESIRTISVDAETYYRCRKF